MWDISAVIFDMDGVLTDTEELHGAVERETCAAFGIPAPPELWRGFKGLREKEIFTLLLEHAGRHDLSVDEMIREKVRRYLDAAARDARLVPGAAAFVRACHDHGHRIALTTSCLREVADLIIDTFSLTPYFSVITTGDEVSRGKPDPEPYALTVERLGLPPEHCAVIEDSDNGIRSARAAGCRVVGITTSFGPEVLRDAGAELVVGAFADLYGTLLSRKN